jgi:hypothetical protein
MGYLTITIYLHDSCNNPLDLVIRDCENLREQYGLYRYTCLNENSYLNHSMIVFTE